MHSSVLTEAKRGRQIPESRSFGICRDAQFATCGGILTLVLTNSQQVPVAAKPSL